MDDFDWVNVRFQCSLGEVFEKLKLDTQGDVALREGLRPKTGLHGHYAFGFTDNDRLFSVFVHGHNLHKAVTFKLNHDSISVERSGKQPITAVTTLDDDGHCVLKVGEKEYQSWQFRKLALDDLLFTQY